MIPTSTEYKRQLIAGNRNWLIKVPVYLNGNVSGTPDFTLTNEHIWDNGITLDNAISSDNSFDIGSAIVGSLKVVINNIDGDYSQYDFFDAKLVLYLGVTGDVDSSDVQRYYRIGNYVVDTPTYNGSLITLDCLDNMIWFDTPFEDVTGISWDSPSLIARDVVMAICQHCGVTLSNQSFPNYDTLIISKPQNNISCREVLQYIAQMCCCYCKIDTTGELVLKWYNKQEIIGITNYDGGTYNTNTTPYSDGCDLDGGHFVPWDGDNADGGLFTDLMDSVFLSQNFEINVSTDDVVVTGCRVRNNASDDEGYDETWVDSTVEQTHERYVLVIDNNPFITKDNASDVANIVGSTLAGLPIRGFTATSLADFSYETGDMATVVDFRGNRYYTWLTHTTFTTNNSEQFSCGVESLKKRSEQRFSTVAETVERTKIALSAYDKAVKAMDELAQNAIGYNEYVVNDGTGNVMYRYNGADTPTGTNPQFPNSTVVFKISGDGVFVSTSKDSQGYEVFTNGYDANSGTAILNLIYSQGINCDWIHAGTLKLGGNGNQDGSCEVYDSTGANLFAKLDNQGVTTYQGSIDGTLTMGANGKITFEAAAGSSSMDSFTAERGGFSVKHTISSGKHATIAFGTKAAEYARVSGFGWTGREFVYYNGSSDARDGGICCVTGNVGADLGEISVLRQNALLFYKNSSGDLYYTYGQSGPEPGSDKRIKKEIKELPKTKVRKFFNALKAVSFKYKDSEETRFGVIAQNVEEALENAALENDAFIGELPNGYKSVRYLEFIGLQNAAIKDLYERVNTLEKELAELKARKE